MVHIRVHSMQRPCVWRGVCVWVWLGESGLRVQVCVQVRMGRAGRPGSGLVQGQLEPGSWQREGGCTGSLGAPE